MLGQQSALRVPALPLSEVGVLDRQLRQLNVLICFIELCQLLEKYLQSPGVADDVMNRKQQNMLVVGQLEESYAQQRPPRQIECFFSFDLYQTIELCFSLT